MRIKGMINKDSLGVLPTSPCFFYKKCIGTRKENFYFDICFKIKGFKGILGILENTVVLFSHFSTVGSPGLSCSN